MKRYPSMSLLTAAAILLIAPVQAAEPAESRAQHGDWTLLCSPRDGLPPCELAQAVTDRAGGKPVMRLSIAYGGKDDRYGVQFEVPTGIFVQGDVPVRMGDAQPLPGFRVTRCEATGCFIDRIMARKELDPFYCSEKGAIALRTSAGEPMVIPLSFKGFADGMRAMEERNRTWAKGKASTADAARSRP